MHACEESLQYEFRDRELLEQCLTHSSFASTRLASNERLEFLGDAVLGLIVCELLYRLFPQHAEGEMTRLKSMLVSRQTCARITKRMGLENYLNVGKGLTSSGRMPSSIKAAVLESLIAGVYLDGGMDAAREVVERLIEPEVERVTHRDHVANHKSLLQQYAQRLSGETPVYRVLDEKGPDHSKCFQVAAVIGNDAYPAAWGPNKKAAEQNAAENALRELQGNSESNSSE
jgi:ribonuclease-3